MRIESNYVLHLNGMVCMDDDDMIAKSKRESNHHVLIRIWVIIIICNYNYIYWICIWMLCGGELQVLQPQEDQWTRSQSGRTDGRKLFIIICKIFECRKSKMKIEKIFSLFLHSFCAQNCNGKPTQPQWLPGFIHVWVFFVDVVSLRRKTG